MAAKQKTAELEMLNASTLLNKCASKLAIIEDKLFGNGHEGFDQRLIRIEEKMNAICVIVENSATVVKDNAIVTRDNSTHINALTGVLAEVKTSVDIHHKSLHFSQWIVKGSSITLIVVAWMLMHTLATYTPYVLNWVLGIFKLPSLPIPQ